MYSANRPSSQIHQVDDWGLGGFFASGVFGFLYQGYANDGVGSGWGGVHLGGCNSAVGGAFLHAVLDALVAVDWHDGQVLSWVRHSHDQEEEEEGEEEGVTVEPFLGMLPNFKSTRVFLWQQVSNFFHVDF